MAFGCLPFCGGIPSKKRPFLGSFFYALQMTGRRLAHRRRRDDCRSERPFWVLALRGRFLGETRNSKASAKPNLRCARRGNAAAKEDNGRCLGRNAPRRNEKMRKARVLGGKRGCARKKNGNIYLLRQKITRAISTRVFACSKTGRRFDS